MDCPRCQAPMRVVSLQNVEIDLCSKCEGVWLDQGELQTVLNLQPEEIAASEVKPAWESEVVIEEKPGISDFECPRCGSRMFRYYYTYDPNILIDGCEMGCGIFTDDGEIKKIWQNVEKTRNPLSPEKEAQVQALLAELNLEPDKKDASFMDSLVKMDNQPDLRRYPGSVLQYLYNLLSKAGV